MRDGWHTTVDGRIITSFGTMVKSALTACNPRCVVTVKHDISVIMLLFMYICHHEEFKIKRMQSNTQPKDQCFDTSPTVLIIWFTARFASAWLLA